MAGIIKCLNLILGYKDNRCRGHKQILALLKPKGLVKKIRTSKKIRVKG